jgi:hypothetical protein
MVSRASWAILALTGCVSVTATPDSGLSPPFNTCPAHPCTAYSAQSPEPICNGGACLVASLYSDLVLVISLSEDSDFAPGQTIAIPYGSLFLSPTTVPCSSQTTPCAQLPGYAIVQGAYTVQPSYQLAGQLDWNLGNPGLATALPVHVSYRPLWPPGVDAVSLGLPLDVIQAFVVVETAPSSPPGPGQGPSIGFQANLQAASYELYIQPDPPFDSAFPPEVKDVTLTTGTQNEEESLVPDYTTAQLNTNPQIPKFEVSRAPGGLVGWQAYLRDQSTLRRVSSLVTPGTRTNTCAAGTSPCTVLLPTNHDPADKDALTGTELVLAPPADVPAPTFVATSIGGEFPSNQAYPALPTPLTVSGTVTDVSGKAPVEAELFFQVAEENKLGGLYVSEPTVALNTTNFDYVAETMAVIDSTGQATYSITLPPGEYNVIARPLDTTHQVTIVPTFEVDPTAGAASADLRVDALRPVQGLATVADGRPMAGALVEAVPSGCASGSSPQCMPRSGMTTTAADGTFALALDPGSYVLRVEPQAGTFFPWVTQPLLVGPTPVSVPVIIVPAPVHAGVQLFDPYGNAVAEALVRVYQVPATGPAVEVGRALTDATGTYDMYLAPSSP